MLNKQMIAYLIIMIIFNINLFIQYNKRDIELNSSKREMGEFLSYVVN